MFFLDSEARASTGFTLVEMAVALAIVALLIGGMLIPFSDMVKAQRIVEAKKEIDQIKEALFGYALQQPDGNLPCPAISAVNGQEARNSNSECLKRVGLLPWEILGVGALDPWGQRYGYSVTPLFAQRHPANSYSEGSRGDITIDNDRGADGNLASNVIAVVFSHGPNGYHAYLDNGNQISDISESNPDEDTNAQLADSNPTFISRSPSGPDAPAGEFDDIVAWIPAPLFIARMMVAGKLPR